MFDKSKETQNSLNDAAQSVDEVAQEVKKQMSKFDQTVTSVKAHIRRHKTAYTVGGTAIAIAPLAFVGGKYFQRPIVIDFNPTINNTPVFNNHNIGNVVHNTVNNGGHLHKMVKCLETGQIWESVTEAAEAAETPLSYMSRHINGHKPDVFGKHYQIVGIGTTG